MTVSVICVGVGISILAFLTMYSIDTIKTMGFDSSIIISISVFGSIGTLLIILGLIYLVKELNTQRYGKECYGKVEDIKESGASINEQPEYISTVLIINPETSQIEEYQENTGYNVDRYPIGSFVLCKHYKKDINVDHLVPEEEVPLSIRERLDTVPIESSSEIELSVDRDYITIDNIKYKKED